MKKTRPRRPNGRWVYYIMYEDILWPCPVRWEWESGYGGWLPFYYSPTFEFLVGDPEKAQRIAKSNVRQRRDHDEHAYA
ncbi:MULTISPECIES: hypothetical protein [Pantoea]|uniref:Uncharacterized protein n=1 Tax=Candidatus Pantoea multigeneris TaxID=2608357 RepID=A0ABX0RG77_9GAMM|nr:MULTISPECIES: hypothetical protein [Pantoea]NIF23462.1 hypothetical protein [Pantoea multigeneris]